MGLGSGHERHYFTMHGENGDRLSGRPGRDRFGTGKAAAFGIAKSLRADTVKSGLRNVVRLTRETIEISCKRYDTPMHNHSPRECV